MPRAVADFDTALENIGVRLQETGGQQYGARRLETLRRYLAKRGVTLEVGSSELAAGAAGEFRASANGIARLLLKANPTKELVWHELSMSGSTNILLRSPLRCISYNERNCRHTGGFHLGPPCTTPVRPLQVK